MDWPEEKKIAAAMIRALFARAEAAEQMLEDACNEAWQEGHSEGMTEAQGAHADLWSMLLSHLEKHGIVPASDVGEGHSAYQMMDAIHEREAEIKARVKVLEEALRRIDGYDVDWTNGIDDNCNAMKSIARAALEAKP
jgi:flagellar biosynthesis/type III secretory pathway protein FliH